MVAERSPVPAREPDREQLVEDGSAHSGSVRRLGSAIGLVTITVLDLLALDDITTAGAWMPEIGFVIASIPALITLAYFTFRRGPQGALDEPERQGRLPRG